MELITFTLKGVPSVFSLRNFREIVNTFVYNFDKMLTKNANNDTESMLIMEYGSTCICTEEM